MSVRIHGVVGGPRQKISRPRTKVDRTNYLDMPEKFQEAEAIIVSSKDNTLEFSKLEEDKPEPVSKTVETVDKPKKKEPAMKQSRYKAASKTNKESKAVEESQTTSNQETEEDKEENLVSLETQDKIDEWLLKLSHQGD